jgi:hypothetical protein
MLIVKRGAAEERPGAERSVEGVQRKVKQQRQPHEPDPGIPGRELCRDRKDEEQDAVTAVLLSKSAIEPESKPLPSRKAPHRSIPQIAREVLTPLNRGQPLLPIEVALYRVAVGDSQASAITGLSGNLTKQRRFPACSR